MRSADKPSAETPAQRLARLEAQVQTLTGRAQAAETALANLRRAYTQALEQLQLMKRRLFLAKAERADGLAGQLAFDAMFEKVEQLAKQLDAATADAQDDDDSKKKKVRNPPSGRRDLSESDLPVERVEILDAALEETAERIGFDETSRLGYERGGMRPWSSRSQSTRRARP